MALFCPYSSPTFRFNLFSCLYILIISILITLLSTLFDRTYPLRFTAHWCSVGCTCPSNAALSTFPFCRPSRLYLGRVFSAVYLICCDTPSHSLCTLPSSVSLVSPATWCKSTSQPPRAVRDSRAICQTSGAHGLSVRSSYCLAELVHNSFRHLQQRSPARPDSNASARRSSAATAPSSALFSFLIITTHAYPAVIAYMISKVPARPARRPSISQTHPSAARSPRKVSLAPVSWCGTVTIT